MSRVRWTVIWIARAMCTGLSMVGASLTGMGHLLPVTQTELQHLAGRPSYAGDDRDDRQRWQGPPSGHPERLVPLLPMSEQERRLWAQLDDGERQRRPSIDKGELP